MIRPRWRCGDTFKRPKRTAVDERRASRCMRQSLDRIFSETPSLKWSISVGWPGGRYMDDYKRRLATMKTDGKYLAFRS
jgi:hypothetical protein